jgi:hypothetical protein
MRWLVGLAFLGGCDDETGFNNPCDPQNAAAGQCPTDAAMDMARDAQHLVDRGAPDHGAPDMRSLDMRPPLVDMTPPVDMAPAIDMAPDMPIADMQIADMGPPAPIDSVCRVDEVSADCIARDCNQGGCEPGPVCDAESGVCLPPGPGDCAVQGCLNAFYCGPGGHCIERCETAGCPVGKRCDYNTSRCVPAGSACEAHAFNLACTNANNQIDCEQQGGRWGVWVDRGDNECKCPAPDAGCPCTDSSECAGDCVVPADLERVCRAGLRSRCATANFPEVCQCPGRYPEGRSTNEAQPRMDTCPP